MVSNNVMMQSFEWNSHGEGFYQRLAERAPELKMRGVDSVWLPPVYKASSPQDVGYGTYDLFDLGEFDQKGAVGTKYGTKEELLHCIQVLHEQGIRVYADVVLNHKAGADETEATMAIRVNPDNRSETQGEPLEIDAWTGFTFPGRGETYNAFKWHREHFTGVDYDNRSGESAIFRILGDHKGWALGVSGEHGNFDYLMFADIDHSHPDVVLHLKEWSDWFVQETGVDGFRMDAVKHIDDAFLRDFCHHVHAVQGEDFYIFGEYWKQDEYETDAFMHDTEYLMDLFDVPLHFNMYQAAKAGAHYDLRRIFDQTLVATNPLMCVTFVDNHDSQPGQSLESWVEGWFKPHAYALILLRRDGYPCVFAGDYVGLSDHNHENADTYRIDQMMWIRKALAWGDQTDYFETEHTIGWVRHGSDEHPNKLAVVMTNGDMDQLWMDLGHEQAGRTFVDYLGHNDARVVIGDDGRAAFPVSPGSVSAYAQEGLDLRIE